MIVRKIVEIGERRIEIEVEALRADVDYGLMSGLVSASDDPTPPLEIIERVDDLALLVAQTIRGIEGAFNGHD